MASAKSAITSELPHGEENSEILRVSISRHNLQHPETHRTQVDAAGLIGSPVAVNSPALPALVCRRGCRVKTKDYIVFRGGVILVMVIDQFSRYMPGILRAHLDGIEEAASEYGLRVHVVVHAASGELPPIVLRKQVKGLIFIGAHSSDTVRNQPDGVPAIGIGHPFNGSSDKVIGDDYRVGQLAAEYLIRRGHRHLGFLCVMFQDPAYQMRAEAFEITAHRKWVRVERFINERPGEITGKPEENRDLLHSIGELVLALVDHEPRISGLFVPNDMMTAIVYAALQRRDFLPGRDVDVISCNNELVYLLPLKPQPATIDIGAVTMGRHSVEQLVWRMDHLNYKRTVRTVVEPILVKGENW